MFIKNAVYLVDRTTLGGDEIIYDAERLVFTPETIRQQVTTDLVAWLYRTDKKRVWTTEGEFVHRYAVEDPPQSLIDACGPEVGDCSPITMDTARVEGWDTTGVPRERTTVERVNIPPHELRDRMGAGGRIVHAEKG